jgi:hypothetical protein
MYGELRLKITKCQALQVYVVVENWRLNREAKGANAENEKNFDKLVAFLNQLMPLK